MSGWFWWTVVVGGGRASAGALRGGVQRFWGQRVGKRGRNVGSAGGSCHREMWWSTWAGEGSLAKECCSRWVGRYVGDQRTLRALGDGGRAGKGSRDRVGSAAVTGGRGV